jgi:hypothetical protein
MNLADERLKGLDDPALTEERRAALRCEVAADLAYAGQYEAAREAMGELWPGIGERPNVKRLSPIVAAEVLLQCGVLTGWLGTRLDEAGCSEATIAELMGHSSPKTTRRYTHGTDRAKREAVEATRPRAEGSAANVVRLQR